MADSTVSSLNPLEGGPALSWQMEMIQCPLHIRWRVVAGVVSNLPPDLGLRARRAWVGSVAGDEGVWVGYEVRGEVKVTRVDVGADHLMRTCGYLLRPMEYDKH